MFCSYDARRRAVAVITRTNKLIITRPFINLYNINCYKLCIRLVLVIVWYYEPISRCVNDYCSCNDQWYRPDRKRLCNTPHVPRHCARPTDCNTIISFVVTQIYVRVYQLKSNLFHRWCTNRSEPVRAPGQTTISIKDLRSGRNDQNAETSSERCRPVSVAVAAAGRGYVCTYYGRGRSWGKKGKHVQPREYNVNHPFLKMPRFISILGGGGLRTATEQNDDVR